MEESLGEKGQIPSDREEATTLGDWAGPVSGRELSKSAVTLAATHHYAHQHNI